MRPWTLRGSIEPCLLWNFGSACLTSALSTATTRWWDIVVVMKIGLLPINDTNPSLSTHYRRQYKPIENNLWRDQQCQIASSANVITSNASTRHCCIWEAMVVKRIQDVYRAAGTTFEANLFGTILFEMNDWGSYAHSIPQSSRRVFIRPGY